MSIPVYVSLYKATVSFPYDTRVLFSLQLLHTRCVWTCLVIVLEITKTRKLVSQINR